MTQKKYVVTEYKLRNLFDAGTRSGLTISSSSIAKQSSYYQECLKEPYVEHELEGWRKKWEPVSAMFNEVLFVSEPDRNGKCISIQKTETGDLTHYYHQHPGGDHERGYRWALMKKEPEVVKYVRWIVLDKHDNSIGDPCSSEQLAREATCELLGACRFVKVEGSYTK